MSRKKISKVKKKTGAKKVSPERAKYDYHLPVMLKQACDMLVIKPDGTRNFEQAWQQR